MNETVGYIVPKNENFYIEMYASGKWIIVRGKRNKVLNAQSENNNFFYTRRKRTGFLTVVVFITYQCNLSCDYCKFSEFVIKNKKSPPNVNKIIQKLNSLAIRNKKLDIVFFGGEPFLEAIAINKICEALSVNHDNLTFSITTNGTIITKEIIKTINKFDITVGFSIDGMPYRHNMNRVFHNNNSSHNIVTRNYKKLKKNNVKCGPISVVTVPSELHDTFYYFLNEFRDKSVHLKPLAFNKNERLESIKKYYNELALEQLKLVEKFLKTFRDSKIKLKEIHTYRAIEIILMSEINIHRTCDMTPGCGMGETMIAINPDGSIFDCYYLHSDRSHKKIKNIIKERGGYCKNCIYSPLCPSFCLAQIGEKQLFNYIKENDASYLDVLCKYNRKLIHGIFHSINQDKELMIDYFIA